ncbi:hypothetical protein FG87_37220 [Nocardia vulneris]|uniref:Uncharacterized protein n=1 Tax=Nocardia vulneris TaxID=1141657 RepID=A0ABR4Z4W9_9NOCA|nr:hypothetical protein FG87_37220 [Nocardia vulneris]
MAGQATPQSTPGPLWTWPTVTVTVALVVSALTAIYFLTGRGLAPTTATALSLIPAVVICAFVLPASTGATLRRRVLAALVELSGGVNRAP